MYKHVVMWKLKEKAEGSSKQENALTIKSKLEKLKDTIPEIITIEVGIDLSCSNSSYDLVLYSEFEDKDACERYLNHPAHKEAGDFVGKVRLKRIAVDYESEIL